MVSINEVVHNVAISADRAFDEKNTSTLKKIAEDCLSWLDSNDYNDLEKAILAYHGATAYSNYISIVHKGKLDYSEENNNETDFEFCLLLFRRSLQYFNKYREDEEVWNNANEEHKYYGSSPFSVISTQS